VQHHFRGSICRSRNQVRAAPLAINPGDVECVNRFGVAYYYTNQPDRALEAISIIRLVDRSKHVKTL
jgi:hypothetical protein